MTTDNLKKKPDPMVVALEDFGGNLNWAVKSISRRIKTNADGDTTLLALHFAVNVGDEGFEIISQLESLEVFDATDSAITNKGVKPLGLMPNLRDLILDICEINDDALQHLSPAHSLRRLSLSGTRIGDPGLPHLSGLTNLESLNLSSTNVTNHSLEHLSTLSKLTHLDLSECNIRDPGMAHLRSLRHLRQLSLNYNRITDEGAQWLKGMGEMELLHMKGNFVTEDFLRVLIESMPGAKIHT